MKTLSLMLKCTAVAGISAFLFISCSKKSGCPTNGKNVGAERLLNGEKIPKAKKFKA